MSKFLYFYAVAALLVPNIALCFTEQMPLLATLTGVALPLFVYTLLMALGRCTGRQVWLLFPLVFFAAFQMVLVYLYGNGVIAVDMFLNLVTTNPGEAMELLDNLVPAVAGVFVLYLPLLVIAAWQWSKKARISGTFQYNALKWSLRMIIPSALLMVGCYVAWPKGGEEQGRFEYHMEDHVYPVNVAYNLCLAVHESWLSAHYEERVRDFRFDARPTHAKDSAEVYVLVVGETARSANFQLYGYRRATNPELSATDSLLVFHGVRSQSNTTHKSVPMLLSAANAADHGRLYRERGIIAAFREAGFHTMFVSNQLRNHSYIDYLGQEADECLFIRDNKADNTDSNADAAALTSDDHLLPYIAKALDAGHKKLFIVMHTYGSHFNYRDRYPQSRAHFMPDTPTDAKIENRPQLVNAYDNTILQTDHILASVIRMLKAKGVAAAMMYTSDHGENIFDDSRRLFLHASPRPSQYDTDVPLIVWASPQYAAQHPSVVDAMRANRTKGVQSNASVFPTMLSMAGITTPKVRQDSLSLASPAYRLGTRLYLNDHNHAVPLSMYGIR